MAKSATRTFFTTPELVLLLSERLTPQSLARCTSVCKDWSRQFEHLLWSNFCLNEHQSESFIDTPSLQMKAAVIRNLPLIRTIEILSANSALLQILAHGSAKDPTTRCNNLKVLEIGGVYCDQLDVVSERLTVLLDLNQRLTTLELMFQLLDNAAALNSLSKLANLKHLTVWSENDCKSEQALLLLEACLPLPNLIQLFLIMEVLWCERDQDILDLTAVIKRATTARFHRNPKATKIQRLQLPSKRNRVHNNPLPLLLLRSNLLDLESCEIPWFEVDTKPKMIERVVRKYCPKLKHVICPSFKDQELDGQSVYSFINGCTGIQSFTSNRFVDQEPEPEPRYILSALVGRHSDTLEVLELTKCYQANSCELQDILSQCKRLKKFWVMNSSPGDYNIGIESTHILKEKWVCMDLRKLGLTLNRFPEVDDVFADLEAAEEGAGDLDDWDEAKSRLLAMAAKNVYTQIGRLVKLEVLVLSIDRGTYTEANQGDYAWDLTLFKGWLRELKGLKSLKTLILQGDFWSRMGQAEVEFIHEHWPVLKEISLSGNALQLKPQSPWRWLLNKRPQLRLDHEA